MTDNLEFRKGSPPPPPKRGPGRPRTSAWWKLAEQAKANPGKWVNVLLPISQHIASGFASAMKKSLKDPRYRFVTRHAGEIATTVYCVYESRKRG